VFLEACSVALVSITLLSASAECSPTSPALARVEFAWQLDGGSGDETSLMLEISVLRHDFSPGPNRFVIQLAPGTTRHVFEGRLVSGTVYHWRVRADTGDPSRTSGTASFESPACAVGDQVGP
jgi:hypothetical protein